jgi:hypothetical protein
VAYVSFDAGEGGLCLLLLEHVDVELARFRDKLPVCTALGLQQLSQHRLGAMWIVQGEAKVLRAEVSFGVSG